MKITPEKRIQSLIKNTREEMNLSQVDLAKKLGVARERLAEWEAGKHIPSATILFKMADLIGKEVVFGERPTWMD